MAVTTAGTRVRRAPVPMLVLVLDLMFVLLELETFMTKLELQAMVVPQVNAKEATAAERTVKTALWRVVVVCAVIVTAVGKAGLMAVARAGTQMERAPVLAVTVLLDLLLDLVELALVATKFWLSAMAPPTVNANVATAAALTVTTRLMRLLVKRPAIVAAVGKAGLMAVATAGTRVRRAPVPVLVLVLDLMFVLLELETFMTKLELQAMVVPQVNAKEATAAERTVKTALWRVVVVRAAIVTAVCKTGIMTVVRAGTQVERAPVLAVTVLLDLLLDLVELALVATKFGLNAMAPPTVNANVATAVARTAAGGVFVMSAAAAPAVVKKAVLAAPRVGPKVETASVLVLVLVLVLL